LGFENHVKILPCSGYELQQNIITKRNLGMVAEIHWQVMLVGLSQVPWLASKQVDDTSWSRIVRSDTIRRLMYRRTQRAAVRRSCTSFTTLHRTIYWVKTPDYGLMSRSGIYIGGAWRRISCVDDYWYLYHCIVSRSANFDFAPAT